MANVEHVYKQISAFAQEAGAQRVVLFGSRARGSARPKSDIDLAIEGCPNPALFEDRLQNDLWSLLRIDLVNLDEPVSDDLRAEIARDGVILYEKA